MAEALVEYDYEAEQEDELTLRVGDIIRNVVTADGGWWEGELRGKKGMFPDNFVKLKVKEGTSKKEEKREATQRKSVRELANKFKDGVPLSAGPAPIPQKKKEAAKTKKCKVLFDYKPENEDELELMVGQTLTFIKEVEEGWWEGSVSGKTGVFPSNFVEMMENGEGEVHSADSNKPHTAATESEPIRGKKVVGVGLGNIFQGGPIKLRNTTKKDTSKMPKTDDKDSRQPPVPTADVTTRDKQAAPSERAIVRHSYTAEQPDELSLEAGEVIRVLDKQLEDEGWWRGEAHGKVGVFPDNFVELLPPEGESSKAPRKPPPPSVNKNAYPKLPDKSSSVDDKNLPAKKDQEEEGVSFDAVESSSHKLTHLTASRAKGPKKRLPTAVHSPETERAGTPERKESGKSQNHINVQPEKPPLPINKDHKHISPSAEMDRSYHRHNTDNHVSNPHRDPHDHRQPATPRDAHEHRHTPTTPRDMHDRHSPSVRDTHDPRHGSSSALPTRPPDPARHHAASPDTSALARLVEDLQREVRELRSQTVSKNDFNDLHTDLQRAKQDLQAFRASHSKKLRDLMVEVDEEKKLRLNAQVEMERVKKLLAETHV